MDRMLLTNCVPEAFKKYECLKLRVMLFWKIRHIPVLFSYISEIFPKHNLLSSEKSVDMYLHVKLIARILPPPPGMIFYLDTNAKWFSWKTMRTENLGHLLNNRNFVSFIHLMTWRYSFSTQFLELLKSQGSSNWLVLKLSNIHYWRLFITK